LDLAQIRFGQAEEDGQDRFGILGIALEGKGFHGEHAPGLNADDDGQGNNRPVCIEAIELRTIQEHPHGEGLPVAVYVSFDAQFGIQAGFAQLLRIPAPHRCGNQHPAVVLHSPNGTGRHFGEQGYSFKDGVQGLIHIQGGQLLDLSVQQGDGVLLSGDPPLQHAVHLFEHFVLLSQFYRSMDGPPVPA